MTTSARRAGLGVIALLLLVATAIFVRGHWGSLYDDAFIYLRYARNLREGCGLRWNCEDTPVEGFTSPAWLALIVLASGFTTRFVLAGETIAAVSLALMLGATVVFSDRLAARVTTSGYRRLVLVGAVALSLGADHLVLVNGVVGVESPLVALAILAFAAAVFARRPWLVVAALLGAVLVRPECALLVLALPFLPHFGKLADASRVARDERRRLWLLLVCGLALEVGVRFALFGDVVPNTFWAKSGGSWRHAELGAAYIGQAVVTFPALLLAPTVLAAPQLRREAAPLLGAFFVWMAVFLWTGGDFFAYSSRFAFPLVPVSTALAVCGVFALAERARDRIHVEPAAGAALLGVLLAGRAELHRLPDEHGFANVLAWTEIGARLRKEVPGAHLAAVPIGAIGLYSHAYVLDLVGLTRRDIAVDGDRIPASALTATSLGHERYDLRTLDNERPDVIVTTVTRSEPFVTLDDVHPQMFVERVIVDAVRQGRLGYHVVDMEVAPGAHWLLLQLGGSSDGFVRSRIEDRSGKGLR